MSTSVEVAGEVRSMVRDFPQFFETEEGPLQVLTIRLPHPLVSASSLQVYITTEADPPATELTTQWELDERNGILKLTNAAYIGKRVLIAGYHYVWFTDSDIARALRDSVTEILYTTPDKEVSDLSDAEVEITSIGAVVHLLWSLCIELALDIDVSTPEGMFIPAHQRYAQVLQMMQYWEGEYTTRAQSLNLGYGALEVFHLRRVAYTTGRYVPMYINREIDDPRWPKRVYPPIPDLSMAQGDDDTVEVIDGVEIATAESRRRYRSTAAGYPSVTGGWLGSGPSP
jgi:hypothetical protein